MGGGAPASSPPRPAKAGDRGPSSTTRYPATAEQPRFLSGSGGSVRRGLTREARGSGKPAEDLCFSSGAHR